MILSRSFYPDLCDVPPAANNNVVDTHVCYAAFTPGHMLPDTSCIHLYPLIAVNMYLVSATQLSSVCHPSVARYKGIQVDWTVT